MMSLDGFFNFDTIKSNTIKNYEVKKIIQKKIYKSKLFILPKRDWCVFKL